MTVVRVREVSKVYRLGLTRASVPSLVSAWITSAFERSRPVARQRAFAALTDVSFDLRRGEALALIGANGAGKSTILKILAGITRPTSGSVHVEGRLSALIELGAGFHPDLTGRENIFLNGILLGLKRAEIRRRFDEIVAFSELEEFIDTPVKRYSSGMAVRLGFSVAACIEPEILLVDEVLAVGDASFRSKCMDRIRRLLDGGTSILFVSHNAWLVQAICTKALYIDHGRVTFSGPVRDAIEVYEKDVHARRVEGLRATGVFDGHKNALLEIVRVTAEPASPSGNGSFRKDLPVEVRVRYEAFEDLGPAHVRVRIIRSDGLTCCMLRTKADDFDLQIGRGEGVVTLLLDPVQLYGGMYVVQAIVRDATDSWPIASASSEPFYIEGSELTTEELHGVFEPQRRWAHQVGA